MANNNPGMTAGTYTLQGEATCEWDSVNGEYINCSAEDSQYYSTNITTLQTAFGVSNCSSDSETNPVNYTYYKCSAGGLDVGADSLGYVDANAYSFHCYVDELGASSCVGVPYTDGSGSGGDDPPAL
jgi:hypothetical protein